MKRLVHSTDEIVMLRESNERYRKALEEIKDENELLWDQLSDIQASDRALKRQMSEAMEDAYYRNIKPVGDA
ncbi:MAG TPA: hypothetical protein EYN67_04105 [Flavobacteriales bacterium]|nr:hypothetical protein [Flavobacteriales bacterium]